MNHCVAVSIEWIYNKLQRELLVLSLGRVWIFKHRQMTLYPSDWTSEEQTWLGFFSAEMSQWFTNMSESWFWKQTMVHKKKKKKKFRLLKKYRICHARKEEWMTSAKTSQLLCNQLRRVKMLTHLNVSRRTKCETWAVILTEVPFCLPHFCSEMQIYFLRSYIIASVHFMSESETWCAVTVK